MIKIRHLLVGKKGVVDPIEVDKVRMISALLQRLLSMTRMPFLENIAFSIQCQCDPFG